MNYWESHTQVAVRFRRFDRKRYAAFRSMHKVINIGVVTASTLLFALPDTAQAQKVIEPNRTGEEASVELEEVEVTASRAPIARNQATKIVTVIPAREIAAAPVTSIQDLLEYAAGIDVRQRGEGGTQADISIRGGTFDQIAVLLNGVNLSTATFSTSSGFVFSGAILLPTSCMVWRIVASTLSGDLSASLTTSSVCCPVIFPPFLH